MALAISMLPIGTSDVIAASITPALLHTDCDVINQAFTGNDAAQMVGFQHSRCLVEVNIVRHAGRSSAAVMRYSSSSPFKLVRPWFP